MKNSTTPRCPQLTIDRRGRGFCRKERTIVHFLQAPVLTATLLAIASLPAITPARAAKGFVEQASEPQLQTVAATYFSVSEQQLQQQRSRKKWKRVWIASWLAFAAVNVLDAHSSVGHPELNPLLRGHDGRFSTGKAALLKAAIGGGFFGLQLWMAKSNPGQNYYKSFSIATGAAAAGLGAIAVRNYGLGSPPPSPLAPPKYLARTDP